MVIFSQESRDVAYQIGLSKMAPVIQRLMDVESELQSLKVRIATLEAEHPKTAPHLRVRETR